MSAREEGEEMTKGEKEGGRREGRGEGEEGEGKEGERGGREKEKRGKRGRREEGGKERTGSKLISQYPKLCTQALSQGALNCVGERGCLVWGQGSPPAHFLFPPMQKEEMNLGVLQTTQPHSQTQWIALSTLSGGSIHLTAGISLVFTPCGKEIHSPPFSLCQLLLLI